MTRRALTVAFSCYLGLMALFAGARAADELPRPTGPVVLTIAGKIGAVNRDPSDPLHDSFLAYHEKSFKAAAEFDLAMLRRLGTATPKAVPITALRLASQPTGSAWMYEAAYTIPAHRASRGASRS